MPLAKYDQIRALLETAGSRFVSIEFIKKDGSLRQMTIQPEALKTHVKGDAASEQAKKAAETRKVNNPNLLNVYDVGKRAIRSINMDTLVSVTIDGVTYKIEDLDNREAVAKDPSLFLILRRETGEFVNQFTGWKEAYEYLDFFRKELTANPEHLQVIELHRSNLALSKDRTEEALFDYLRHHPMD